MISLKKCPKKVDFGFCDFFFRKINNYFSRVLISHTKNFFFSEIPQKVEYNIRVRPVHQLEVLGLKTELVAGSDPTPFGVAGYDSEENEFDTLDGLQLTWYEKKYLFYILKS